MPRADRERLPSGSLTELWARTDRGAAASDRVHFALRQAIVSGVLPSGTRLAEEELAGQFEVSRTPVREAVLRLEAEGLAERSRRRGLVVAHVSEDEILELYVVRLGIDGLAARLAADGARPADVANLRWHNEQLKRVAATGDAATMAQVNLEFHEAMCRAGHNEVLFELMSSIHDRVRRFPGTVFSEPPRALEAVHEHDEIIAAIEDRNPDLAEKLARTHMENAMAVRRRLLQGARQPLST